jgi:hypothetical protein
MVGGRVTDLSGRVLWAGGFFGFGGFLGSPDAGRPVADVGYHGFAFCQRSVDGVSPLFWVADARFLLEAEERVRSTSSLGRLASELALEALSRGKRVIATPFLEGRVAPGEAGRVRPAELPVPPAFRSSSKGRGVRRYYHPQSSRSHARPYQPEP